MKGSVFKRCTRCQRRVAERRCPNCGAASFSWAYRAYVGKDASGRWREQFRSGFDRKADADRALAELMASLHGGSFVARSSTTVGAYLLDQWLPATAPPRVRYETWNDRRSNLELYVLPRIGGVALQELSPAHLNRLYTDLLKKGGSVRVAGLSPTSVRRVHALLRKAFNDAVRWGLIERNPALKADPPPARLAQASRRSSMTTWEPGQLRHFLDVTWSHAHHASWVFAATTGVRRSELLGLRWRDVDLRRGLAGIRQTIVGGPDGYMPVQQHKTDASSRTLHLDSRTLGVLRMHRDGQAKVRAALDERWEDHGLVFCRDDGRWRSPSAVSASFRRAVARVDSLPAIRFHDLRHTHATLLLAAGVNPKVVSERLGHSSVSFTLDTYAHVMPGMQPEAAQLFVDLIYPDTEEAS